VSLNFFARGGATIPACASSTSSVTVSCPISGSHAPIFPALPGRMRTAELSPPSLAALLLRRRPPSGGRFCIWIATVDSASIFRDQFATCSPSTSSAAASPGAKWLIEYIKENQAKQAYKGANRCGTAQYICANLCQVLRYVTPPRPRHLSHARENPAAGQATGLWVASGQARGAWGMDVWAGHMGNAGLTERFPCGD
jgi:hypothetical protein